MADVEGPWIDPGFDSGLIDRCKRYWNVPVSELPNGILATYLRQRIALCLIFSESQRRIEAGIDDDSEMYEVELAAALRAEQTLRHRGELVNQYGPAFYNLSNLLFAEDPMGINFESNTDEYEPEARTILPRLNDCRSVDDVRRIVHEEFARWFAPARVGSPEKYHSVATRIWGEIVPTLPI